MGRLKKRIISIICVAWMVFLPFGAVYASVDCLFHDDSEHISHGVEIASDYSHSHDTIALDLSDELFLADSGTDMGDTSIEKFVESHCSSGFMMSISVYIADSLDTVWKDPFFDVERVDSLIYNYSTQEIRPPIAA